jgi:hypothetical protein
MFTARRYRAKAAEFRKLVGDTDVFGPMRRRRGRSHWQPWWEAGSDRRIFIFRLRFEHGLRLEIIYADTN